MLANVQRVFVIQETETGYFLAESLVPVRSLAKAGRCYSREEAEYTARLNLQGLRFEVHTFLELEP